MSRPGEGFLEAVRSAAAQREAAAEVLASLDELLEETGARERGDARTLVRIVREHLAAEASWLELAEQLAG